MVAPVAAVAMVAGHPVSERSDHRAAHSLNMQRVLGQLEVNRRAFLSMMLGAPGAPLVPWRGLVEPLIVLPALEKPHVCDSPWCNHPAHAVTVTAEQIAADIERCLKQLLKHSGPIPYTQDGFHLIETHLGEAVKKYVPPSLSFEMDGQMFAVVS